jgi:hypothetical protein
MKRAINNSKFYATLNNIQKIALIFSFIFALEIAMTVHADAQRHGGMEAIGHVARAIGEHHGHNMNHAILPLIGFFNWYVPAMSLRFFEGGMDYYFYNGFYYRDFDGRYEMVPAPIGHRVKNLPMGYEQFTIDGLDYFYSNGTFYIFKNKKFEVVTAPVGAEVQSIPNGSEKVEINGQSYYTFYGVQYKPIIIKNEVWYKVIKSE